MIKFEKVTKKYGDTEVLKEIDLEMRKGEITILIGPSGCGKTTTLKMINRLIEPTSGKIFINGEDIGKLSPIELRRNIGYVIQQIGLFPHMTVAENVGLVPYLKRWPKDKRMKRVEELLELVGLPPRDYMNRYPSELSGGQQQRVGVARALASDPEIILMDEPFSALDPITREQLQEELFNLQQELQKTIVFVTHDIDEALKLGDRICIMRDGIVLQFDAPEVLLKNPAHGFVEEFIGKKRLMRAPDLMTAEDVMIKDPVKAHPRRTLAQAVEIMKSHAVNSILVVDESDKLLGIVTAGDIREHFGDKKYLDEIYTKDVISVRPNESLSYIIKLMAEKNIGFVPVTDDNGILVGLITRSSLINIFSERYF